MKDKQEDTVFFERVVAFCLVGWVAAVATLGVVGIISSLIK